MALGGRALTGAQYALLRPEFNRARPKTPRNPPAKDRSPRIFICFGGTDWPNATEKAMLAFSRSDRSLVLDVVIGAGAPHFDTLRRCAGKLSIEVQIHSDPDNLVELMQTADIAIGAAGSMSWERSCLGCPSVVMVTAGNQTRIALALEDRNAAINLGRFEDVQPEDIAAAVEKLLEDGDLWRRMYSMAMDICDGQGAHRVWEAMEEFR